MIEKKKRTLLIVFASIALGLTIFTLLMEYGTIAIFRDSTIGDFLNSENQDFISSIISSRINNTADIVIKAITGITWIRIRKGRIRGQESVIRSQESVVRGQESVIRGQESVVRGQESEQKSKINLGIFI